MSAETAEAIRAKMKAGERLTQAECDQLVAYVDTFTDDEWVTKLAAEHEAAKPQAQRDFETAVRAWWDQHDAWLRDGCPDGGDPGPAPQEPPGLYPPPMSEYDVAVAADEEMKRLGMEPYRVREYERCREVNATKKAALDAYNAQTSAPKMLDPLEVLVLERVQRLRVDEEAKRRLRAEKEGPATPLDVSLGTELAQRADEALPWRVEGILPAEGNTLLSAQRKAGKTTLALNLIRSLLTGEDFLGCFKVTPPEGRVGFLNYEVAGAQIGRWAAEAGIPLDELVVANLRGRRNPLGHDDDRAALAWELKSRGVEVLVVDPFANAFTGDNQDSGSEVGPFLQELDRFAREEVGASDLVLVNHAGWNAERSRGSSALEDWPDSIIRLKADAYGTRYLSAMGRDVDVAEGRLEFDPETRRLTLDRSANAWSVAHQARTNELVDAIVAVVTEVPGVGTMGLQDALKGRGVKFAKADVQPAIDTAVATRRLERRAESKGKKALYPASQPAPAPSGSPAPGTVPGTLPTLPVSIDTGGSGTGRETFTREGQNNKSLGGSEVQE